jgi:hypothetical protein
MSSGFTGEVSRIPPTGDENLGKRPRSASRRRGRRRPGAVARRFTGHAVLATSPSGSDLAGLALDGVGAALQPAVLRQLTGVHGTIEGVDATLVAHGNGGGQLPMRPDLEDHPRVLHAESWRQHVRVHGDEQGLVTLAKGLGRDGSSLSVEAFHLAAAYGHVLVQAAFRLVPVGEPVFAAVSPGNARSFRVFIAAGFRPIGSEVLIVRRRS